MKFLHWVVTLLVIIGAINWGLVGAFQFDLVSYILHSSTSWMARSVYTLIGIAGLLRLRCLFCCKCCH